ncbi:MAG: cysteine desulfurase [Thermoplasmata archaeon]|nr:cysteine desulfurase [Thermoplasmata archaeon]
MAAARTPSIPEPPEPGPVGLPAVRSEFPALRPREGSTVPAYLDSACMSLVPNEVLAAMEEYYRDFPGCGGRSLHRFAEEVSHRFEGSRASISRFLRAAGPDRIVFVRNATEAINVVGRGLPWKKGDRVLITDQEHNSNLVLWQRLAEHPGIEIDVLRLEPDGTFEGDALARAIRAKTRLVSVFETSNLDGRSLPIQEISEIVHDRKAKLLVDGCQAAPHRQIDLARTQADFYAISMHKMLGPTGTGVLAGAPGALEELEPLIVGGETVEWTTLTDHQLRPPPHRFEAGLQNYAGVLGAGAAIRFLERVGVENISEHDRQLNERVTRALDGEPRVHLLGPTKTRDRPSIFAFTLDGIDPHDAAIFLDTGHNVMVRSGMHCAHSWYAERGIPGNVRASFYLYNTPEDTDRLLAGIREMLQLLPGAAHASATKRRVAAAR